MVTPSGLKIDISVNPEDGTSLMSLASTKTANIKSMSRKEASIRYGTCLYKAKKCLESVKQFIDGKDYDN
jgi:fructose-1,6-bisphosphatase/sedoheptulose 1,7-bisphosphatase-like protein